MVSRNDWIDYPSRRRRGYRWNKRSSKWTQRYSNPSDRWKKTQGRTQYTNIAGMGMMPTYGYFGGTWSTRSIIGTNEFGHQLLGPWQPALT